MRSQAELNTLLFEDLKLEAYDNNGCLLKKEVRNRQKGETEDDLILYNGLHPVIEKLLEFREVDASVAGFCDKNTYLKIRSGIIILRIGMHFQLL